MAKRKPKTYVLIVLDSSYSMGGGDSPEEVEKRKATLNDYNEKVSMYKSVNDQEVVASLVTFNHEVTCHYWCENAEKLQLAKDEHYVPDGGTALNDAIGYCITRAEETINPILGKDDAVLMVIISDGDENSSKKYTSEQAKSLVKKMQGTGQWNVTYMGANVDVKKISREYSIPASNCATFSNKSGEDAEIGYANSNVRMAGYFKNRKGGMQVSCNYASDTNELADFTKTVDNGKWATSENTGESYEDSLVKKWTG